jgi:hypothetical protein
VRYTLSTNTIGYRCTIKIISIAGDNQVALFLVKDLYKDLKIKALEPYREEKYKFKSFFIQVDFYFIFNSPRFKSEIKQVLYIIFILKKDTLNWIKGFVVDYIAHTNTQRAYTIAIRKETQKIFGNYIGFIN